MANERTSKPTSRYHAAMSAVISFIVALPIGAFIGAFGEYWNAKEQVRTDVVRQSYIDVLKVTRENNLDLEKKPGRYIEMTAVPLRNLAVHGGAAVLTDMVKEWEYICTNRGKEIPPCCGPLIDDGSPERPDEHKRQKAFEQIKASVSVVRDMREEVKPFSFNPFASDISDSDLMLLLNFCHLPESPDKMSCDKQEKGKYCFRE